MNKYTFTSSIAGLVLGFCSLMAPCSVSADMASAREECAKELLLSYFPEPIVKETLKRFNIPQDKWPAITKSLSAKDKEVVKMVEQKAATMNPNPLKDPQQRQAAVKLFRETLLQVFSDAMKENGVQDASQFQAMLDDIQQQKAKKFAMCMERQKANFQKHESTPSGATAAATSDDEADSDDDEDDDDTDEDDEAPSTQPATPSPATTTPSEHN